MSFCNSRQVCSLEAQGLKVSCVSSVAVSQRPHRSAALVREHGIPWARMHTFACLALPPSRVADDTKETSCHGVSQEPSSETSEGEAGTITIRDPNNNSFTEMHLSMGIPSANMFRPGCELINW